MRGVGEAAAYEGGSKQVFEVVEAAPRGQAALPPRPALPPTLSCALSLWAVCACAFTAARSLEVSTCLVLGLIGLAAAIAALVVLWRARATMAGALLLGAALGLSVGMGGAAAQHVDEEAVLRQSGEWRFVAAEDASSGTYGYSCLARVEVPGAGTVLVLVRFSGDMEVPRYGDVFTATATLSSVSESSADYRWRQGVVAQVTVYSIEYEERDDLVGAIVKVRNKAIDLISGLGDGEGPAILAALVCGYRELLDGLDVYEDFKTCGLAHLVAVSGAHLSIVSSFIAALLDALRAPRPVKIGLQLALILCYLVLAAVPISAVRAAAMAAAGMFSYAARRRTSSLGALSLCIIVFIVVDPATSVSVSFALSALSTLGITVFTGFCGAWVRCAAPFLPRSLRDAVSLTLSSNILSTGLSAAMFSQVPLASPITNAVVAPIFPLVCAGGLLATVASLLAPALSSILLGIASAGTSLLAFLVGLLAQMPYASIAASISVPVALVLSIALAAVLWLWWPRPRRGWVFGGLGACAAALACLIFLVPLMAGTEIVMLDVGQGDAFLVRSQGVSILIDTGNQDTMLRSALARHGVTHLDAVVITHGDDDHMGSLASLAGVVEVDQVLVAADAFDCGCEACEELLEAAYALVGEENVRGLEVGDVIEAGKFELEVIWPEAFSDEGGNADSLCLLAGADIDQDEEVDWTALFVGDAEVEQLEELLESGAVGEVDIYKVGHHGSKNALDEDVALALSPQIALVSVGEDNSYGHPADSTLEALEEAGASIFRTDEEGDVICKLKADRIVVRTQG